MRRLCCGLWGSLWVCLVPATNLAQDHLALAIQDFLQKPLAADHVPLGLNYPVPVPQDNPLNAERVELGRRLFFDSLLSADQTLSCGSCHRPDQGFAARESVPTGVGGKKGRRNTPSLFNRAFGGPMFWDGRAESLEAQALKPIESPDELANSVDEVLSRLRAEPHYQQQFGAAFDDGITAENLAMALASFERVILSADSPIDRFQAAIGSELTPSQKRGLWIYESNGRCWKCHSGPNYSDEKFHNTGVSWGKRPLDLGRFEVTGQAEDQGAFKTPTLREVAHTAPYMHDGSIETLREVVEFYNRGGGPNPHQDAEIRPLNLQADEVDALVDFLMALSGTHPWSVEKMGVEQDRSHRKSID